MYAPGLNPEAVEILIMELALPPDEREIVLGFTVIDGPEGEVEAVRAMEPERLFRLVREIVEVPKAPGARDRAEGVAVMVKSGPTLRVKMIE
jgi:hypothetical protein